MVTNVLNYGRSGVADWVVQRFSALILAAYTVVMVIWVMSLTMVQPQLDLGIVLIQLLWILIQGKNNLIFHLAFILSLKYQTNMEHKIIDEMKR